jgi:hypothetical protein
MLFVMLKTFNTVRFNIEIRFKDTPTLIYPKCTLTAFGVLMLCTFIVFFPFRAMEVRSGLGPLILSKREFLCG